MIIENVEFLNEINQADEDNDEVNDPIQSQANDEGNVEKTTPKRTLKKTPNKTDKMFPVPWAIVSCEDEDS